SWSSTKRGAPTGSNRWSRNPNDRDATFQRGTKDETDMARCFTPGVRRDRTPDDAICATIQYKDRKSTRLNSSHVKISYAVFCLPPLARIPNVFPYTTLFRSELVFDKARRTYREQPVEPKPKRQRRHISTWHEGRD